MLINATLMTIHVIVSLILIVFILLHSGRGGGLSDMFGGVAGGSLAGIHRGGAQPRPADGRGLAGLHVHDDAAVAAPRLTVATESRFIRPGESAE